MLLEMCPLALKDDLEPTMKKVLSKSEVLNWCLSYNYRQETISDVNLLIDANKEGFLPLNYEHENAIHIKTIEKMHGGKPEYMHPVSNLYKLYKFVPANGKWFFIQSVKKGFFVIRTKELSYKIEY